MSSSTLVLPSPSPPQSGSSEGAAPPPVSVTNTRSLKMNEDVLSVAFSPDNKYLAVALLDSTIKVRVCFWKHFPGTRLVVTHVSWVR